MPFTPSHAVVALAFVRTPLVPAAVAVGAMTPDLPLFVRGTPVTYSGTHDLLLLPATVVLAAALLLAWRCVLRPAATELSPAWLARRLPPAWDGDAAAGWRETLAGRGSRASLGSAALLLAALAVGIVSHIVWDLFTHEGRWGVALFPALAEMWGPWPGFRWLQHGSSVLGLLVLTVWAVVWLRARRPSPPMRRILPTWARVAWWLSLPSVLVSAWLLGLALLGPLTAEWTPAHLAYRVLPPACALWAVITTGLCVAIQVRRARTA